MTTEYLLDTNACIAIRDLIKGKKIKNPEVSARLDRLKARWSRVPAEQLAMSIITLGELQYGAVKSGNAKAVEWLAQVRKRVQVLNCDETTCTHYGDIRATLERNGQGIGPHDTWIAAHGRATGRTVVTNNLREFTRVSGLTVEDWTA